MMMTKENILNCTFPEFRNTLLRGKGGFEMFKSPDTNRVQQELEDYCSFSQLAENLCCSTDMFLHLLCLCVRGPPQRGWTRMLKAHEWPESSRYSRLPRDWPTTVTF